MPGTCFLRLECPCVAQRATQAQMTKLSSRPGQVVHLDIQRPRCLHIFAPKHDFQVCFFQMCCQKGCKCFLAGIFQLPGATDMRKYAQIIVRSFKNRVSENTAKRQHGIILEFQL